MPASICPIIIIIFPSFPLSLLLSLFLFIYFNFFLAVKTDAQLLLHAFDKFLLRYKFDYLFYFIFFAPAFTFCLLFRTESKKNWKIYLRRLGRNDVVTRCYPHLSKKQKKMIKNKNKNIYLFLPPHTKFAFPLHLKGLEPP